MVENAVGVGLLDGLGDLGHIGVAAPMYMSSRIPMTSAMKSW